MKNFYLEHENGQNKRDRVLEVIKPICDAFGIKDYDYILTDEKERLVVEGQEIGCRWNSIGATVMELINWIWCNTYAEEFGLGSFERQTLKFVKKHWKNDKLEVTNEQTSK